MMAAFHVLVRPPRLRAGEEDPERRATWFELFFDLAFVAAIASLARAFEAMPTPAGLVRSAGLFVPIWWAWVIFTYYADRFDTDDLLHRALMALGMVGVAEIAVSLDSVGRGGDVAFVVAYLAVRAVPVALYLRAGRHDPLGRLIALQYGSGSLVAAAVWVTSLAIAPPLRYWLWALAVGIELSLPLLRYRTQRRLPPSVSHIPERFGLFTIIVLAQAIVDVTAAVATGRGGTRATAVAILSFLMALCVWWVYFDFVPARMVGGASRLHFLYTFGHAPLLAGIVSLAVGTTAAVEHAGAAHLDTAARWALGGGVGCFLLATGVLHLGAMRDARPLPAISRLVLGVASVAVAALWNAAPPVALVATLAGILAVEVVLDVLSSPGEPAATVTPSPAGPHL